MTTKIAVGLNFFLEALNLPECLESIKGFDAIIAIDGKYPQFDYPSMHSDDGSVKILKKYKNVIYVRRAFNQIRKRNTYLQWAWTLGYDFLLVVDADFRVDIDWPVFRKELERLKDSDHTVFNVEFNEPSYRWQFALLYKPGDVEYHELHHILRCKRCHFEMNIIERHTPAVRGIRISHKVGNNTRSRAHIKGRLPYRKWKMPYENALRIKRGLPVYMGMSNA